MTATVTHSTPEEVNSLIDAAYEAAQRLPVAFQADLANLSAGRDYFLGVVRSTPVCDPADAAGTVSYRRIHGLPPLTTPTEGTPS